jgi:hypothetical protein
LGALALGARSLGPGRSGDRHDSRQATWPSTPAGLLTGAAILLLDPFLEFRQPFVHRPLELRARRARFFRPDPWAIRADGFGWRIAVAWFGLERDLRREFGHLPKS